MSIFEATRWRLSAAAGLGSLLLMAAACTSGASSATQSASASASATNTTSASASASESESEAEGQKIVISNTVSFGTDEITVAAGEAITVSNVSQVPHTFTEGENGEAVANPVVNQEIEPGEEEEVTFDKPGDYHITCRFHQAMNLEVHVE
jgi:plastocyanin